MLYIMRSALVKRVLPRKIIIMQSLSTETTTVVEVKPAGSGPQTGNFTQEHDSSPKRFLSGKDMDGSSIRAEAIQCDIKQAAAVELSPS
jgi:hypothetical protein